VLRGKPEIGPDRRSSGTTPETGLRPTSLFIMEKTTIPAHGALTRLHPSKGTHAWPVDFPRITQMTSLARLRNSPGYLAAKAGHFHAALQVILDVARENKLLALARRHRDAIIVAVHAEEAAGRNKLPQVFAEYFAHITGLPVNLGIVQTSIAAHTGENAFHRMANQATFDGPVQPGGNYILVDDAVTLGGTLNSLRLYIEDHGANVVDIVTLASAKFSNRIALTCLTRIELETRFGSNALHDFLTRHHIHGGSYAALTEAEARLIKNSASLDSLGDRIAAARPAPHQRMDTQATRETAPLMAA
jgi:hypothetical protein